MSEYTAEVDVLIGILDELKKFNELFTAVNTKPIKVNAPIQRDYTAYHAADTVYPFGRQP